MGTLAVVICVIPRSVSSLTAASLVALLLAGCGGSIDYDKVYRESLAEGAEAAHAEDHLDRLPTCTSIKSTVISNGPCVFEGELARPPSFGGRRAP
jgi:hypothetical protein